MKTTTVARMNVDYSSPAAALLAVIAATALGSLVSPARSAVLDSDIVAEASRASTAAIEQRSAALSPTRQLDQTASNTAAQIERELNASFEAKLEDATGNFAFSDASKFTLQPRAMRRLAQLPAAGLLQDDLADFRDFLSNHSDIQRVLDRSPSLVTAPSFLVTHSALASFLDHHPSLSTVLLERAERRQNRRS